MESKKTRCRQWRDDRTAKVAAEYKKLIDDGYMITHALALVAERHHLSQMTVRRAVKQYSIN